MAGTQVSERPRTESGRLAELYARYGPSAVRLAYLLTGDRGLAEDLAQDAFVRLAGRFLDLRDPSAFEAYLRRTVVNLARMHFRRRLVERAYLAREEQLPPEDATLPDIATYEQVKQALLTLSPRQRSAIVLRYYEDLSEREIAEILNCRPGTVKSLVSRGMQSLREQIQGE